MKEVKFSTGSGGTLHFSTTISAKGQSNKKKGLSVTQFMDALQLRMIDYMKVQGVYQGIPTVGARDWNIPTGGAPISDPEQKRESGKNRESPGELRRGIHEGYKTTGSIQKRSIVSEAPYTNAVISGTYGGVNRSFMANPFLYRAYDYVFNTDNKLLIKGLGYYLMEEVIDIITRPTKEYGGSREQTYSGLVERGSAFDYVGTYHNVKDVRTINGKEFPKTNAVKRDFSYNADSDNVRNIRDYL